MLLLLLNPNTSRDISPFFLPSSYPSRKKGSPSNQAESNQAENNTIIIVILLIIIFLPHSRGRHHNYHRSPNAPNRDPALFRLRLLASSRSVSAVRVFAPGAPRIVGRAANVSPLPGAANAVEPAVEPVMRWLVRCSM
jgi:hypothetical protein